MNGGYDGWFEVNFKGEFPSKIHLRCQWIETEKLLIVPPNLEQE